jgi:hypothetical protein
VLRLYAQNIPVRTSVQNNPKTDKFIIGGA